MILLKQLAQTYLEFFLKLFEACPNFAPPRTPVALPQNLCQNTSYLYFIGLNNWFYAIITIFTQHLNTCSPKLGEWRRLSPSW